MRGDTTLDKAWHAGGACMRIILQKNGMYCAQVIFKSVVGGWLWVRVRKYFAHFMGGLESFCTT